MPLLSALKEWQGRSSESKRDLLSLIGHLSFAAMVVPPGRTFIRQLLDLSCTVSGLSASLTITNEAHCDIQWWLTFASTWNESPSSMTSSEPGHLTLTCTQMSPTLGLAAISKVTGFWRVGLPSLCDNPSWYGSLCQSQWHAPFGASRGVARSCWFIVTTYVMLRLGRRDHAKNRLAMYL